MHEPPVVTDEILPELSAYHDETLRLAGHSDQATLRGQYHPLLSPLGWHVGHCSFIETLWVQGELLGRYEQVQRWQALYQPNMTYKPARGMQLPGREDLIAWCRDRHAENLAVLTDPPRRIRNRSLLSGDYLLHFLVQHYAQHLETMAYVLAQRAQRLGLTAEGDSNVATATAGFASLGGGRYTVGCDEVVAYDNERERHEVDIPAVQLMSTPVSGAEYQAFIEDGGYRRPELWDAPGWAWRCSARVEGPALWRYHTDVGYQRLSPDGWQTCRPETPVAGVSQYEAEAFARWAGGRLPHEHEWEAAHNAGLLDGVGQVWEWCSNSFHPYTGFHAFPYEGYSTPWFDGGHYVMRGASHATRTPVQRPSFRNFYTRDIRHVFAGLRLAFDG